MATTYEGKSRYKVKYNRTLGQSPCFPLSLHFQFLYEFASSIFDNLIENLVIPLLINLRGDNLTPEKRYLELPEQPIEYTIRQPK
jgi:hypothetical protein